MNPSLTTDFRIYYRKATDNTKLFSERDRQFLIRICSEYKMVVNELAFVVDKFLVDYRYMDIGRESQKEFTNLVNYADKIANDSNPGNFKIIWNGHDLPGMVNDHNEIFTAYKEYLMKQAAFLKNQIHTPYITGRKNSFVKELTKELYNFLISKFNIGPDQSKYVIGYIFCHWQIYLTEPFLTEAEFKEAEKNGELNHLSYLDYLKSKVNAFLRD